MLKLNSHPVAIAQRPNLPGAFVLEKIIMIESQCHTIQKFTLSTLGEEHNDTVIMWGLTKPISTEK